MSSAVTHTLAQQRLRPQRTALAVLLVFALLCAQSLGLWHRLVHPGPSPQTGLAATHAKGTGTSATQGLLTHLFSQHAGQPDCQLFDHASLGDAMGLVFATAVALVFVSHKLLPGLGFFAARWHAQFQARGPPLR